MSKGKSFIVETCSNITKISMYALVLLMPIFFLPWTSNVLDFNKQALLVLLTCVAFFAWMLKTLVVGELRLNLHKAHIAVGSFFLVYVLSAIFSVYKYGSLWGSSQVFSQSLLSIACLCIVYFLVSNEFSEKEIAESFLLLGISVAVAQVYAILQLFGLHIIPLNFAKTISFNTVGSTSHVGLLSVALLPLFMIMAMVSEKWKKIVCIVNVVLIFCVLILLNYYFLWWIALVGAGLTIFFGIIKSDIFDGRWMFLPMFFLIVSLFFILLIHLSPNYQLRWLPNKPIEVSVSHKETLKIDLKALKASPLLGSGPGTFAQDFTKYKSENLNETVLWNVNFNAGSSKFLTELATVGILGFLAWLAIIILPLFYAVKYFVLQEPTGNVNRVPWVFALLITLLVQVVGFALFTSNMILDFVLFFSLACLVSLGTKRHTTYQLKSSSLVTLGITFIFTLVFIFGLGFLLLEGQRYFAEVHYTMGLRSFNSGKVTDGIRHLKIAASNNLQSDTYFSQLAISSMANLQNEISNPSQDTNSDNYKAMIRQLTSDAINAANVAVSLGPNNIDNWAVKGSICQNLIGIASDAKTCALDSYQKARALNPTNPYLLLQEGNVYLAEIATMPEDVQASVITGSLTKAKEQFNAAITLKKDYAAAYLQLAVVARYEQKYAEELKQLKNASLYSQNDASMALQIGVIYYQDKNWEGAIVEFKRALSLAQNYANAAYYLGLAYDQAGQKNSALELFNALAQAYPDNQNIKKIIANIQAGRPALTGFGQPVAPEDQSETNLPTTDSPKVTAPSN